MTDRTWQIALFGTFDVENYGDLLFPLIADAELSERLGNVKLHRFSYQAKSPPEWPYEVISLEELPGKMACFDGALIGGGFIIRFDKDIAPGYEPASQMIHHPTGYWLSPALLALQHNVPLMWNAPGTHRNDFPNWAEGLVRLAFEHSEYIAVRDWPTQIDLSRFVDPGRIEVVPDTGFGVSRLVDVCHPSAEFTNLRKSSGLTDRYIIVQTASSQNPFWRFAKQHSSQLREYRFLALPISPILGEHEGTIKAEPPGLVRLPSWPAPLQLAELISQATAVVGHSYHLAITALAFGVPVFSPAEPSEGKYTALADFDTFYPFPGTPERDIDWFISRLKVAAPSSKVVETLEKLEQHWDNVATVLRKGNTKTSTHLDRFWQSMPTLLESASDRTNEIQAAADLETTELKRLLALARSEIQAAADLETTELKKLLALARSEIVTRDERIAALHDSPSWKSTAPLRFVMRNLKRLVGYTR